jgi:hypothetical protein
MSEMLKTDCTSVLGSLALCVLAARYLTVVNSHVLDKTLHMLLLLFLAEYGWGEEVLLLEQEHLGSILTI